MDPVTLISTTLSSIKTAIDISKVINISNTDFDLSILKMKMVELNETLVNTKGYVLELKEELFNKQNEIKELEEELKDKSSYIFNKYYYFRIIDENEIEGPYCPSCYENEHKKIHLIKDDSEKWICNVCKIEIKDDKYKERMNSFYNALRNRRINRPFGFEE